MKALLCLGLALVLIILPTSSCNWEEISSATITISEVPNGFRAVFMAENCSFEGEGDTLLGSLDALSAALWCSWASEA